MGKLYLFRSYPFLLLLFFSTALSCYAQQSDDSKPSQKGLEYIFITWGSRTLPLVANNQNFSPLFLTTSANFFFTNNLILATDFHYTKFLRSDSYPSDYSSGLCLFGCGNVPEDILQMLSLTAGYSLKIHNPKIRFAFQGGPSWVRHKEAQYIENEPCLFCSSHTVSYPTHQDLIGLHLKSKFEFVGNRFFGIGITVEGNLNQARSVFLLGASYALGYISHNRPRIVRKARRQNRRAERREKRKQRNKNN